MVETRVSNSSTDFKEKSVEVDIQKKKKERAPGKSQAHPFP